MKTNQLVSGTVHALSLLLLVTSSVRAAEDSGASPSLTRPARGQWQQHMTLGPGDILNISLLDNADSARLNVPVGPDGRITFLQAHDIMASGLTIDELREKFNEALGKYYTTPHSVIT